MVGVVVLLMALVGCGTSEPSPTPMPPSPERAKAPRPSVRAKAKTGNMVHGKAKGKAKGKARGKAPRGPKRPPPVGGAGEVKGYLVLDVTEGEGEAPGKTDASMVLAWGEGPETTKVQLGSVPGSCASVEPKPVGPEGREQRTPLWTVACTHQGTTEELYILQAKSLLAVVRGKPGTTKAMVYKPVRRVPLQPTAKLVRAEGEPPAVAEAPQAPAPAPTAPAEPKAPAPAEPKAPAPAPAPEAPAPATPAPAPAED